MKAGTAILLGGTATLALTGVSYYRSMYKLQYYLQDFKIDNTGRVGVMISVFNPSAFFGYPVPAMYFDVYDKDNVQLGTIYSDTLQYISASGYSYLYAWANPNALVSIINAVLMGATTVTNLLFKGVLTIGRVQVPVSATLQLNA